MRWKTSLILAGVSGGLLVSCGLFGGRDGEAIARQRPTVSPLEPRLETVKVGEPYDSDGQRFTPTDQVNYDEVGYASWYGNELRGNETGNGEAFNPDAITAAHRTLPMPSYVEVTNLDSGRTILVRVNDRGPFKKNRIIDLSVGAARQLGVEGQGQFPVRVRRVNPPEFERRQLQNGGQATERLATPPSLLAALRRNLNASGANPTPSRSASKPKPPRTGAEFDPPGAEPIAAPPAKVPPKIVKVTPTTPAPAASPDEYFIQIAAFSSEARAAAFAKQAGASVVSAGNIWRVRLGPYADEASARAALGAIVAKGYPGARVTH